MNNIRIKVCRLTNYSRDVNYGDLNGFLETIDSKPNQYALDKNSYSAFNAITGFAFGLPFIQVEYGYNFLYKDDYINFGVNIPLKYK